MAFKNVALILSALAAVFSTWDAFFNHRTLWRSYTVAANRLRSLREDIRYYLARDGKLDPEMADKLYATYHGIIADVNNSWEELRKDGRDEMHVLSKGERGKRTYPPD